VAAGPKLDGAGIVKMKVLEDATLILQRVHGLVEAYAMAVKRSTPAAPFLQNIRRTLPSLAENLKSQFGLISEQIVAVNLQASRGASEQMRVRVLREGVAQIKQAIDIAVIQTKDKHTAPDAEKSADAGDESHT
jgi:hypothetical protein